MLTAELGQYLTHATLSCLVSHVRPCAATTHQIRRKYLQDLDNQFSFVEFYQISNQLLKCHRTIIHMKTFLLKYLIVNLTFLSFKRKKYDYGVVLLKLKQNACNQPFYWANSGLAAECKDIFACSYHNNDLRKFKFICHSPSSVFTASLSSEIKVTKQWKLRHEIMDNLS